MLMTHASADIIAQRGYEQMKVTPEAHLAGRQRRYEELKSLVGGLLERQRETLAMLSLAVQSERESKERLRVAVALATSKAVEEASGQAGLEGKDHEKLEVENGRLKEMLKEREQQLLVAMAGMGEVEYVL